MLEKLLGLLRKSNLEGLPVPFIKDPMTGKGSVTLTMFIIAFNVSILALAGKVTKMAGDMDYSSVMMLYGLTGAFYLGRKLQTSGKDISISDSDPSPEKEDPK